MSLVPRVDVFDEPQHLRGARLLDEVQSWFGRFVSYPHPHARTAHTLWAAHTHLIEAFEHTPRIAFLSPEPGSGKSRALEVTEPLVVDAVPTVNVSVAYLFRRIKVDPGQPLPTVLLDEADAVFTGKPSESTEELRGLLNSGHRRGQVVGRARIVGKEVVAEDWPAFCPVALAGLGDLPDTLMTRSVVVRMRPRNRSAEPVLPYRRRVYEAEGVGIGMRLAEWAAEVRPQLENAWPELPEGIVDRQADVWEPLIAIADAAGGSWPEQARAAASFMVDEQSHRPATLGVQLLADVRTVMRTRSMFTRDLIRALCELEGSPWGALLRGNPITPAELGKRLRRFEIPTNTTVRVGGETGKGYRWEQFSDAWNRYLPPIEGEPENTEPETALFIDDEEPF